MIIFSLRAFKGCEGKHMLVVDPSQLQYGERRLVVGLLCSASGQRQTSQPDRALALHFEVRVDEPERLIPTTPEASAWLQAIPPRTNGITK